MGSAKFSHFVDPAWIANHVTWYTRDGLIIWNKLDIPGLKFQWRWYIENDMQILLSLSDPMKFCILCVHNGKHWLYPIKQVRMKYGMDYLCNDPWTGKQCYAKATYKNIVGSSHFLSR